MNRSYNVNYSVADNYSVSKQSTEVKNTSGFKHRATSYYGGKDFAKTQYARSITNQSRHNDSRSEMYRDSNFEETSHVSQNFGEALYHRGMVNMENQRLKLLEAKKTDAEKKQSVMTFVPNINQSSLDSESVFREKGFVEKLVKNHKEKINKAEKKVKIEVQKKCTFKPEINKISKEIANKSNQLSFSTDELGFNRCDLLYEISKSKEEKLQFLRAEHQNKECPFKPTLYKPSKVLSAKVRSQGDQLQRAEKFQKIKELNTEVKLQEEEEKLNTMFKPNVGRAPVNGYKANMEPIHEHLYNYKDIYQSKKEDMKHSSDQRVIEKMTSKKVDPNSENILETGIYERFTRLFNVIDNDQDGNVIPNDIEEFLNEYSKTSDSIPETIIAALRELLNE